MNSGYAKALVTASRELAQACNALSFAEPTAIVYNPLDYARVPHEQYLNRYGDSRKRVLFLGMNPGPYGMAQTGVPFGEIEAVQGWMGIEEPVGKPPVEHPKRPVDGFLCARSEVSGRRLWGLFKERFGVPEKFFAEHFVVNYCPLVFMEAGGKNRTPDKLPAAECKALYEVCDAHLHRVIEVLEPEWLVGVGGFAQERFRVVAEGLDVKHGKVLHPSPASPAANRGWAEAATKQLTQQRIWC